ncbi:MAG: DoxX family protein [Xanthobacteraceae bacterium]|jgi:putative oxidoreductase
MNDSTSLTDSSEAASLAGGLARISPYVLSLLRIMAALLFLQHGLSKFFGFPSANGPHPTALFDLEWFAALIEFGGGVLLTLGLFTRVVALVASGEMAIGYFLFHAPQNFYPALNHGELAIMFCFVFLYLIFAGAGPLSLDALIWGRVKKS